MNNKELLASLTPETLRHMLGEILEATYVGIVNGSTSDIADGVEGVFRGAGFDLDEEPFDDDGLDECEESEEG